MPVCAAPVSYTHLDIQGGITKNKKREAMKLQLPYLRVANILPNELDLTEVKTIGLTEQEYEAVRLISGDLLIVEGNGSDTQIGRSAIWNGQIDPCVHQDVYKRQSKYSALTSFGFIRKTRSGNIRPLTSFGT